eukprot:s401_g2.t1
MVPTSASTQLRQLLDFYFDPFTLQHNRYLLDLILKRAGAPQEKGPDARLLGSANRRASNCRPQQKSAVMSAKGLITTTYGPLTYVETRIHEIEMRKRQHEELRGKEEEWRLAHPQPLPKQQAPQWSADVNTSLPILLRREVFPSTSELIEKFKKMERSREAGK